ncbi:uncharacterized protein [Apostichopus japonicus]|uniref:uncharacterized protein n=1 Tax=Stichopus japonicus TaxID=307972 RepID=UPI003AB323BD
MAAQFALISLFWIIKIWSVTCSSAVVVVSNVALSNSPVFENLNLGEWGHFQFDDGNLEFEMECPLSIADATTMGQPVEFFLITQLTNNMSTVESIPVHNCQELYRMGPQRADQGIYLVSVKRVSAGSFQYSLNLNVNMGVLHKVILVECPKTKILKDDQMELYCKGKLKLTNDDHESHLSVDIEWIHYTYKGMVLLWLFIFVFWHYNWIQFRKFSNGLHKLITFVPNLKIIHIIFVWYFWDQQETEGDIPMKVVVCVELLAVLSSSCMLSVLLLSSMGWCIMSPAIDKRWHLGVSLPVTLLFHASTSCALAFARNTLFQIILWSIWVLAFTFFSFMCWLMIRYNQCILQTQAVRINPNSNPLDLVFHTDTCKKQLMMKYSIFSKLKLVIFFYFVSLITIKVLWLILLHEYYIGILEEIQHVLLFLVLAFVFHLEDFSEFEVVSFMPPTDMCMMLLPYADVKQLSENNLAVGLEVSKRTNCKHCQGNNNSAKIVAYPAFPVSV